MTFVKYKRKYSFDLTSQLLFMIKSQLIMLSHQKQKTELLYSFMLSHQREKKGPTPRHVGIIKYFKLIFPCLLINNVTENKAKIVVIFLFDYSAQLSGKLILFVFVDPSPIQLT